MITKERRNEVQRIRRNKKDYLVTKKYEKTKKGFLVRTYRNMLSRVTGIQKLKSHLYFGKEILNKELFYEFSLNNEIFSNLFKNWENNNYLQKLTPSIDRIDSKLGYLIDNIRWLTHSENSSQGNKSRYKIK